jgi:hypothetical protein
MADASAREDRETNTLVVSPELEEIVKKTPAGAKQTLSGKTPSELIDSRVAELGDWRGETLARARELIKQADPQVVEEWKWGDVPVWEHAGIICTGETYKQVVKLTFAKGASLADPAKLFNSSLEGSTRRAIDLRQGEKINATAFKALIKAAIALNTANVAKKRTAKKAK